MSLIMPRRQGTGRLTLRLNWATKGNICAGQIGYMHLADYALVALRG